MKLQQLLDLLPIRDTDLDKRGEVCQEYNIPWERIEKAIVKIVNTEITREDILEVSSDQHMLLKSARTNYTGRYKTQKYTYKGE